MSARVSTASFTTLQIADPFYGEWLDVFVKVLQPLPPPVTGILGAHIMQRAGVDPGVVAAQRAVECMQGGVEHVAGRCESLNLAPPPPFSCPVGETYGQGQVQAASLEPGQELPTAALVAE